MRKFLPFIAVVCSLTLLMCVIYFVTPPKSWAEASVLQILLFFIPFLVFFISLSNLFLHSLPRSVFIGLCITVLAALQSIGKLTIVSIFIVVAFTALAITFFPKKLKKSDLTDEVKIPKLTKYKKEGEKS